MADPRLSPGAPGGAVADPAEATQRPVFYFDFASPVCWLAGERVNHELPLAPVWVPVRLPSATRGSHRAPSAEEAVDLETRAVAQGLPAPRLPDPWPDDFDLALRAATFAAASGRIVAFSLAALRQAYAAGRDLSQVDNVLIAAAACELHPRAVLKGTASRSVEERLRGASDEAAERGVREAPAIATAKGLFQGSTALEAAYRAGAGTP
jgi:2-hydroxychromene-2-carboxylate isomerase